MTTTEFLILFPSSLTRRDWAGREIKLKANITEPDPCHSHLLCTPKPLKKCSFPALEQQAAKGLRLNRHVCSCRSISQVPLKIHLPAGPHQAVSGCTVHEAPGKGTITVPRSPPPSQGPTALLTHPGHLVLQARLPWSCRAQHLQGLTHSTTLCQLKNWWFQALQMYYKHFSNEKNPCYQIKATQGGG